MAGIYLHIPFCKQKCYYCDFYKVVSPKLLPDFISALKTEIKLQAGYLEKEQIETVYFGGGTPSSLSHAQINEIFSELQNNFQIDAHAEITFEANPDDLTAEYIAELQKTPINRISLGIQSFFDNDLKRMNRRHSGAEAIASVRRLQEAGYENISGDLIYGLPEQTSEKWSENLKLFFDLNIPHLSAYHLTYEKDTAFYKMLKSGKLAEHADKKSEEFFTTLLDLAHTNGFLQYEISNFAKLGLHSRHNSTYWTNTPYLGLGPSAHSYNRTSRQWNKADVKHYITELYEGKLCCETEILSKADLYNEFVMKNLRKVSGVNLHELESSFEESFKKIFWESARKYQASKHLEINKDSVFLSRSGIFISDRIISEMFYV